MPVGALFPRFFGRVPLLKSANRKRGMPFFFPVVAEHLSCTFHPFRAALYLFVGLGGAEVEDKYPPLGSRGRSGNGRRGHGARSSEIATGWLRHSPETAWIHSSPGTKRALEVKREVQQQREQQVEFSEHPHPKRFRRAHLVSSVALQATQLIGHLPLRPAGSVSDFS